MNESEIKIFLKANIKPIKTVKEGAVFRCSAYLNDGTYLPCVLFQPIESRVGLALKRFEETMNNPSLHESMGYKAIVASFVCKGNSVNHYDIKRLEDSPYAISEEHLKEIVGETSMGWTEFVGNMDDGKSFNFGTSFYTWFFDMPEGYSGKRIKKIIPAVKGQRTQGNVYREKLFFNCYIPL